MGNIDMSKFTPIMSSEVENLIGEYGAELKKGKRAEATIWGYMSGLTKFFRWLQEAGGNQFPIEAISRRQVWKWAEIGTGSQTTIRDRIELIKRFLNWLYEKGYVEKLTEIETMKLPARMKRERNVLTRKEISQVLEYLKTRENHPIGCKEKLAISLALEGLRISSICAIRWRNVGEGAFRTIVKKQGERTFPMGEELKEDFARCRKYHKEKDGEEDYIFGRRAKGSTGSSRETVSIMFRRILKKAGVERRDYCGPHLWRHSVATILFDETENLLEVQQFMGHAKPETTICYIHGVDKRRLKSSQIVRKTINKEKEK